MKKLLFFAALVAFVVACGGESGTDSASSSSESTASTTPAAPPPADAPDGEKIYKTNCIACHGLYGDMGASGAFNLQESELTVDERVEVITNGRNAMAAWGSLLSEAEIKAVAEYTTTLGKDE